MKATLKDSMGTDLSVVNAARVSFAKESKYHETVILDEYDDVVEATRELDDLDERLIGFLARGMTEKDFEAFALDVALDAREDLDSHDTKRIKDHLWSFRNQPQHSSPFRHCFATFHVKAPIFVARQLVKHQVGMSWNEVSRRYVDDEPEFWWPEQWRGRSENKKQGSAGVIDNPLVNWPHDDYEGMIGTEVEDLDAFFGRLYARMCSNGVAPEMARMILPQNTYTEWIWSGSLQSWAHVCNLRCHPEAQKETRDLCLQIDEQCGKLWPVSWAALRSGG